MLLNLTNHPSAKWPVEQLATALAQFGNVEDMPFPNISPQATEQEIERLAHEFFEEIGKRTASSPNIAVHLMGEMTFCFRLVSLLKKSGIRVVASTTERLLLEESEGKKTAVFRFVKFREY
ncbi:MAG: hypothetical protein ACK4Q5_07440 [Saprospiraceae bacterium]